MSIQFSVKKFVPIDRDYPIFEFYVDSVCIMDFSISDDRKEEIAFHADIAGKVFSIEDIVAIIDRGKELLQNEIKSTIP